MAKDKSWGRFEREAYSQWVIPGCIPLVGLLSALLATVCFHTIDAARVDSCLDAGGSYNYETGECDHEQSHPVP